MQSAGECALSEGKVRSRFGEFRQRYRRFLREYGCGIGVLVVLAWGLIQGVVVEHWYDWFEKRVQVVLPGKIVRGAFQRPDPLRRIIAREHIKTILTLTAYSDEDERFRQQLPVVRDTGVRWLTVPIIGSRPSLEQMRQAADMLNDRDSWPIFVHCVAGHHRTSLALAAYRMRYEGWTAEQAWDEVSSLPWARPDSDTFDRQQIHAFAAKYGTSLAKR